MNFFCILAFAFIQFEVLDSKRIEGSLLVPEFNQVNWKYITKFGIGIGHGSYRIRMRFGEKLDELHRPPEITTVNFEVHIDDK